MIFSIIVGVIVIVIIIFADRPKKDLSVPNRRYLYENQGNLERRHANLATQFSRFVKDSGYKFEPEKVEEVHEVKVTPGHFVKLEPLPKAKAPAKPVMRRR